jgi:hypothetical protein
MDILICTGKDKRIVSIINLQAPANQEGVNPVYNADRTTGT